MKPARKIYDWASGKAQSPYSALWLGLVFALELIFFLPVDAIFILFCIQNPRKKILYVFVAALAVLISGTIGYYLGYLLWDIFGSYIVGHVISQNMFEHLVKLFNNHEQATVFIGGLLPIPLKVVTMIAGFCQLSFLPFLLYLFLSRLVRFSLIALAMHIWGPKLKIFIDRHFKSIVLAIGAKIAIAFTLFWALSH
jgi:membrane protein YqaA with SNARE-associated domain